MLRIERAGKRLLAFRNLRQRPIADFYDLTDFIVNSTDELFGEIGEKIFLLGTHAKIGKAASAAVDLIGVDAGGASVAVVIEASAEEPALSRAITVASRLAGWEPLRFFSGLNPRRSRALRSFLGGAISNLNKRQRVFIIGEKADEELTSAAVWLQQRGVDIVFVEAALGVEPQSGAEYLRCRAFRALEPKPADGAGRNSATESAPSQAPEPDWSLLTEDDLFPSESPEPEAPERRSVPRETVAVDRVVEVEYTGRRLGAHLTDYSDVGVALAMNSPLPIGSTVTVVGQADSPGAGAGLNRKGRVRYCRFEDEGFRLGVAFEQAPG